MGNLDHIIGWYVQENVVCPQFSTGGGPRPLWGEASPAVMGGQLDVSAQTLDTTFPFTSISPPHLNK